MGKYKELSEFIIKNVGGKENINKLTHCVTRLRFNLKDNSLINEEELMNHSGIVTVQSAGGKFQVVVGTHVADVYSEILELTGISNNNEEDNEEKKGGLNKLIDIITKVITPVISLLVAGGLIQGITAILIATNLLTQNDGAYFILRAMGQAVFYFFPIILGYTSAKTFKMSPFVGMILGAALIMPELLPNLTEGDSLYTLFSGTILESSIYKTFFGIPIMFPEYGYTTTVIPIIFSTFFASKIEHFFKERISPLMAHDLVPFLTIFISVPITILVIGPITNIASLLIETGVTGLNNFSPILTAIVVALIYQPLVVLGLHWPLITIAITNLANTGSDYLMATWFPASFAQMAVVLAVMIRTKSRQRKAMGVPALISCVFCIIEPAIYGFTLPIVKRFAYSMIGATIGGVIITLFSADMFAFSFGFLGFASFINPNNGNISGVFVSLIAVAISMLVSFALTYFTFNEDPADEKEIMEKPKKTYKDYEVNSPLKGTVSALGNALDDIFSSESMGKGILVYPAEGKIYAPFDGTLTTMFPTGHAIGITNSDKNIELLIHVGVDTVELDGKYFHPKFKQGDIVKQGDILLEFDIDSISKAGYKTETAIIVTNSSDYLDVIETDNLGVDELSPLLTLIPFKEKGKEFIKNNIREEIVS